MGIPKSLFCATVASLLTLTGCGGGGSPDVTPQATQTRSCALTWAWSNPTGMSGNGLQPTADVTWDNQICGIQTATEASMTVCITHPAPSELSLQLIRPDQNSINLPSLASAQNSGTCPDGTPWTYQLNAASLPVSQFTGRWTLRVSDLFPANNQSGFLIGWSFILKGTN
jgi:hypothetical protein